MHSPNIAVHLELYTRKQVFDYASRILSKKLSLSKYQKKDTEEMDQNLSKMEGKRDLSIETKEILTSSERNLNEFEHNVSLQLDLLATWMEWIELLRWTSFSDQQQIPYPQDDSPFNPEMFFAETKSDKKVEIQLSDIDVDAQFIDTLSLTIESFLLGCRGLGAFIQTQKNSAAINLV